MTDLTAGELRNAELKVPIPSIFIFPSDPIFHAMNFCKKKENSIWVESDFVNEFLKT